MGKTLYGHIFSPNCRSIYIAMKAGNINDVDVKVVDLMAHEQKSEDYLKINPQGAVPTLDDEGFILSESRAVLAYLVSKYSKDTNLYPKDPRKCAMVDRFLNYDCSGLQPKIGALVVPLFTGSTASEEDLEKFKGEMKKLNDTLEGCEFLTGSSPTIADCCVFSSLTQLDLLGQDISEWPNVVAYLDRCKKMECFSQVHGEFSEMVAGMHAQKQQ